MTVMSVIIAIVVRIAIAFVMMVMVMIVVVRIDVLIVDPGFLLVRFQPRGVAGTHVRCVTKSCLLQLHLLNALQFFAAIRILTVARLALLEVQGLLSLKVSYLLFESCFLLLAGIRVLSG